MNEPTQQLIFQDQNSDLRWYEHLPRMHPIPGIGDVIVCPEVPREFFVIVCRFWLFSRAGSYNADHGIYWPIIEFKVKLQETNI